ncbi:MAG: PKD domain-containing protein [Bacteroidota bacterium]
MISAVSDVTCSGANNGSMTVQANGGTQPLTYTWSNGQTGTSPSISGLAPGSYSVTVSDANGCTALAIASIVAPPPIVATLAPVAAHCGQADGSVSASVQGGTPGYTYSWTNGSTAASINNVIPGTYSVTVTDGNGCTQSVQATVADTPPPVLAQTSLSNALCAGTASGSASVSAVGGTGPYTYLWSNGAGGSVASNLAAGSYTVTATDVYGCTALLTVSITEPLPLLVVPTPTPSTCGQSNGVVAIAISGGSQPYASNWSTGASGTTNLSGLAAGSYSATVTDNNGCTQSVQVNVSDLPAPVLANPTSTPVSCNGGSNGTTAVVLVSSTSAVNYSWAPSGGNSATASGLTAGSYTVTATDNNGCTATQTVTVNQPPLLVPAVQSLPALCNGSPTGSASVLASGGVTPYSFIWSNGASGPAASNLIAGSYAVTVTDNNGCTAQSTVQVNQPAALAIPLTPVNANCSGASTGSVSSLVSGGTAPYAYLWNTGGTLPAVSAVPAGTYTVTVTDANGCTLQNTVVVTQPAPVLVQASVTDATCSQNNGTANANASGGTGTLNFTWSNSQTGSSVSGLAPGSYTVTATDANGCTATSTVSLINYPSPTLNPPVSTPVSCNGGANGTASVSVLTGTSPYTYSWSPSGGTSNAASGLVAGNYSVVVTDNNGCTSTTTVVITQPTALILQLSATQATCGNPNGSASAVVSGGSPTYFYSWSGGSINSTSGGLLAGTYTLTVTDNNGCTVVGQVNVPTPPTLAVNTSATPANCNGASTGSVSATASGGTSPFSYSWNNGSVQQNPSGLSAGSYTVVITDANGCTATTAAAVVTQPTPIVLQTQSNPSLCSTANGTAQVSGAGGTGVLNYVWSNGQSGTSISNLAAGSYTATATDANGCTSVAVAAVSNLGGPVLLAAQPTPVSCAGGNNGSASVVVSSGNPPYQYSWTPTGGVSSTATNLTAGNYQVTVTDVNGCIAVESYTITEPLPLQATASGQAVNCNGNSTGSVSVSAVGGVTGYSYSWSNGAATSAVSALAAGTYTVIVTDANGCTDNASYVVTQPPLLSANASVTPVSCNGGNNGTASVSAGGGTAPYAYTWSNGSANSGQNNLVAGTYSVVVTDANGCTRSASGTITQPTAIALQVNTTPSTCGNSNGGISVVGSGGTGALQYQWSNGSTLASNNNIAAGTYTVTATDANGCTATSNAAVNNQGGPQVALQASTNVTCFGGSDGAASVIVNSGVTPFTYSWSPSGGNTSSASGLSAGPYTVNVTDGNGCISGVNVVITQPTAIVLQLSSQLATCGSANGVASVIASGGTGGFSYAWSSGASGATSTGLMPGPYGVTVTDASGCTASGSISVLSPSSLSIQTSSTPTSCNGGSNGTASVVAIGGNPGYTYAWSTGSAIPFTTGLVAGTYTVTVTDADGCSLQQPVVVSQPTALVLQTSATDANCGASNGSATVSAAGATAPYQYLWSNASAVAQAVNLAPGSYTVTVTDANGCTASTNQSLGSLPGPSIAALLTGNSACAGSAGGTALVQPAGGVAPYSYIWSTGATTAAITGLLAGNYTVTVSDVYGCTTSQIGVVSQPQAMTVTIQSSANVSCNGGADGTASVVVSGGAPPFVYTWSNGASAATASGLIAGTYTVTVSDFNGCTETQSVSIQQPAALALTLSGSSPAPCFGQSGAAASYVASGGTPPFSYLWSGGQTGSSISGVNAGTYTVILTDANGCTATSNVTLAQPPALQVQQLALGNITCFNGNDGTASVSANGGTPAYTYSWSNGAVQSAIAGVTAGSYTVTVTDSRGCTAQLSVALTQPATLPAVSFTPPTAEGCEPLFVQFGSNNLGGATYQWNFGDGTNGSGAAPAHLYTDAGTYDVTVTVTDANGCTNTLRRNGIIRVFALPEAFFVTDPAEPNSLDPVVDFYNGSTGAATAWWDFGDGSAASTAWSPSHAYIDTGLYVITLAVRSLEGCVDTFQNKIIVKPDVSFWVPNAFTPNNDGDNETFTGYGINVKGAEFFIFDRWGTVVYESDALSRGWNGTYFNQGNPCPEAVYVYLFRVDLGGTEPKEFTGRVSLVR